MFGMRGFGAMWKNLAYYQNNMIKKKRRKYRKLVPTKEYIVMTEDARVFSGLKGGYPLFSESIDEAKQFTDIHQSDMLHLMYPFKLETVWL
jgi:hypothetical protein